MTRSAVAIGTLAGLLTVASIGMLGFWHSSAAVAPALACAAGALAFAIGFIVLAFRDRRLSVGAASTTVMDL